MAAFIYNVTFDERDDFVARRAPDTRGVGTRWVVPQDPEGNVFCIG